MAYKKRTKPAPVETLNETPIETPKVEDTAPTEVITEQMTFIPDFRIIKVKVIHGALNVRSQPTMQSRVNAVLPDGTVVTLKKIEVLNTERWGELESGVGWINLKYTAEI